MAINEPTMIHPHLSQEIEGVTRAKPLRAELIAITAGQRRMPGMARSWECEDSGFIWVFNLREDARFNNDKPVDTRGFVRGPGRAPETGSLAAQRAGAR
jgi:ABC-type oligopeptide transport system substrate-binding subunit